MNAIGGLSGLLIRNPKFEVYKDAKQEFRWRLKASNGEVIATASEGYTSKQACLGGIELVKKSATAEVLDLC